MNRTLSVAIGIGVIGSLLLVGGCRSARHKKEAEGLRFEENVAVVAVEGVPGAMLVDTMAVQAKVLSINYDKREVKLLVPGGNVVKTKVGPEAVNFDQVKKGDIINAVITEELVIQLASSEADLEDGAAVAAALAEKGQLPAGVAAAAVRITATITAIDAEARTVTLQVEDGTTKTISVRDDIEMKQAKVGDKVVIDLFEAVAVSVDRQEDN